MAVRGGLECRRGLAGLGPALGPGDTGGWGHLRDRCQASLPGPLLRRGDPRQGGPGADPPGPGSTGPLSLITAGTLAGSGEHRSWGLGAHGPARPSSPGRARGAATSAWCHPLLSTCLLECHVPQEAAGPVTTPILSYAHMCTRVCTHMPKHACANPSAHSSMNRAPRAHAWTPHRPTRPTLEDVHTHWHPCMWTTRAHACARPHEVVSLCTQQHACTRTKARLHADARRTSPRTLTRASELPKSFSFQALPT